MMLECGPECNTVSESCALMTFPCLKNKQTHKQKNKPWFLKCMQNILCGDKSYFIFSSVWLPSFKNNYTPWRALHDRET